MDSVDKERERAMLRKAFQAFGNSRYFDGLQCPHCTVFASFRNQRIHHEFPETVLEADFHRLGPYFSKMKVGDRKYQLLPSFTNTVIILWDGLYKIAKGRYSQQFTAPEAEEFFDAVCGPYLYMDRFSSIADLDFHVRKNHTLTVTNDFHGQHDGLIADAVSNVYEKYKEFNKNRQIRAHDTLELFETTIIFKMLMMIKIIY